jgi:hypothetical protein
MKELEEKIKENIQKQLKADLVSGEGQLSSSEMISFHHIITLRKKMNDLSTFLYKGTNPIDGHLTLMT